MTAISAGMWGGPADQNPDLLRQQDAQRQRQLQLAQHGLQMTGTGASTARATQDNALQTAAPWLKAGLSQQSYEQEHGATQQAGFGTAQRQQESELQAGAEQRRMGMFKPYLDQFAGMVGGNMPPPGGAPPPGMAPTPPPVDFGGLNGGEQAAQNAAFARAKDQAGLIGRSAVNSLAGVMGGRGLTGSGLAANAAGGVINQQASQLGDVNREQAITGANMARQRASEQYQGGIAQRGQNVSMRGQDIASQDSRRNAMLGLLQGFQGNVTARY